MDENTKKDALVGTASVGAAAAAGAAGGAAMAAAMAGVVALVSIVYSLTLGRDQRRSERLFQRMAAEDEDPEDFMGMMNERLRDGDEEILTKLRALLRAELESVSDDAYQAIARVGRRYVRGGCEAWVARGWVRLFSEVTTAELDSLRELARATRRSLEASTESHRRHANPGDTSQPTGGVVVLLSGATHGLNIEPDRPESLHVWPEPLGLGLTVDHAQAIPGVYTTSAPRLFDLLAAHSVASTREWMVKSLRTGIRPDRRPAVEMSREAALALVVAFAA